MIDYPHMETCFFGTFHSSIMGIQVQFLSLFPKNSCIGSGKLSMKTLPELIGQLSLQATELDEISE